MKKQIASVEDEQALRENYAGVRRLATADGCGKRRTRRQHDHFAHQAPPAQSPLLEHRAGPDHKPHFGLGLYIVRLIAEFQGGRTFAAHRSGARGAVVTIILPLI